jgi:hypothetical protein
VRHSLAHFRYFIQSARRLQQRRGSILLRRKKSFFYPPIQQGEGWGEVISNWPAFDVFLIYLVLNFSDADSITNRSVSFFLLQQ